MAFHCPLVGLSSSCLLGPWAESSALWLSSAYQANDSRRLCSAVTVWRLPSVHNEQIYYGKGWLQMMPLDTRSYHRGKCADGWKNMMDAPEDKGVSERSDECLCGRLTLHPMGPERLQTASPLECVQRLFKERCGKVYKQNLVKGLRTLFQEDG